MRQADQVELMTLDDVRQRLAISPDRSTRQVREALSRLGVEVLVIGRRRYRVVRQEFEAALSKLAAS